MLSPICCLNNIIDYVVKAGRALLEKSLELDGLCVLNGVNGFACSVNVGILCKFAIIEVGIPYGWSLEEFCVFMTLGKVGTLVDIGTPAVNGGMKVPISGRVIWAVTYRGVVGAVTDDKPSYVILSMFFSHFQ